MTRRPSKKIVSDDDLVDVEEVEQPSVAAPSPRRASEDADAMEQSDERDSASSVNPAEALFDSSEGEEESEIDDASIEAAKALDLGAFASGSAGGLQDAYEDFAKEKNKNLLGDKEVARLVELAQTGKDVERSLDILVRHNIRWIMSVLKQTVGSEVLRYPSDYRNDLLGAGRMGFLEGILNFDRVKAEGSGIKGQEKSILGYTAFWIKKRVMEYRAEEIFRLNADAANDRNKVKKAVGLLERHLGRMPNTDEIVLYMNKAAHEHLAQRNVSAPTKKQLTKAGALGAQRVESLLQHAISTTSLDAPVGDDDDGAPTIAQFLASTAPTAESSMVAQEQETGMAQRIGRIPNAQRRDTMRLRNGLAVEDGSAHFPTFNPEEVALFMGVTRDSVLSYEERFRHELMGSEEVDIDRIYVPGLDVTPAQIRAAGGLTSAQREHLRASVSLVTVVAMQGVKFDRRAPTAPVSCPHCVSEVSSLTVSGQSFACRNCGIEGDIVDWVALSTQDLLSASVAVARLAIGAPSGTLTEDGKRVRVVRDPARARSIRQLG